MKYQRNKSSIKKKRINSCKKILGLLFLIVCFHSIFNSVIYYPLNLIDYYSNRFADISFSIKGFIDEKFKDERNFRHVASKEDQSLESLLASVVYIKTEGGTGTGFFISKKGVLLTNAHLFDFDNYTINSARSGSDKEFKNFKFLLVDWVHDVAIFRFQGKENIKDFIPLSKGYEIDIFTPVFSIGNPNYNLEGNNLFSGMAGYITNFEWGKTDYPLTSSANDLNNEITESKEKSISFTVNPYIQSFLTLSMNISPGASGSPIISDNGNAIGIIHSSHPEDRGISYGTSYTAIKMLLKKALRLEKESKGILENHKVEKYCKEQKWQKCADGLIDLIHLGKFNKVEKISENICNVKSLSDICFVINQYVAKYKNFNEANLSTIFKDYISSSLHQFFFYIFLIVFIALIVATLKLIFSFKFKGREAF